MKPLLVIHIMLTAVLLLVILGVGVLTLTETIEVRIPAKNHHDGMAFDRETRASATSGAKARLLVVRGAKPNMEYPIFEGQNIVGRADEKPVEIDIEFQEMPERIWSSRQHAVITYKDGSLTIEDLNSSNGTYVNRSRVPPGKKQELKANDIIQIGEIQMKVLL